MITVQPGTLHTAAKFWAELQKRGRNFFCMIIVRGRWIEIAVIFIIKEKFILGL